MQLHSNHLWTCA